MSDLQSYINGGRTVEDLIDELSGMDPKAIVVFTYNYGDRGRTMVAESIGSVEEGEVAWSAYHRLPKLVDEDDDRSNQETINVVVLG